MCEEFKTKLIAQIPIEPELMKSCDIGKSYYKENPDSITSQQFHNIYKEIILEQKNKSNK